MIIAQNSASLILDTRYWILINMAYQHRRNFLPILIVNVLLWSLFGFWIINKSPDVYIEIILGKSIYQIHGNIVFGFFLFFVSSFLSLSLLLASSKRGFWVSYLIDGFLLLVVVNKVCFEWIIAICLVPIIILIVSFIKASKLVIK